MTKKDEYMVGTVGIENYESVGLLRSLAVKNHYKNQKIGTQLINYVIRDSCRRTMQALYLLTTTAKKYFEQFHFYSVARENAPDAIQQTKESSAIYIFHSCYSYEERFEL